MSSKIGSKLHKTIKNYENIVKNFVDLPNANSGHHGNSLEFNAGVENAYVTRQIRQACKTYVSDGVN